MQWRLQSRLPRPKMAEAEQIDLTGDDGAAQPQPAEPDPWVCSANDAVRLQLVSIGATQIATSIAGGDAARGDAGGTRPPPFAPRYTHQVFRPDETIHGYQGLSITLSYNAASLASRFDVAFDSKRQGDAGEVDDVEGRLTELLGEGRAATDPEFAAACEPVGEIVHTYERHGVAYEVRRANLGAPRAREHNERLTSLLLLFVDGASGIDGSDPLWVVFTCYQRPVGGSAPTVAGFTTVYPFNRMVRGEMKEIFRLSQMLVLPPYQRGGHGAEMLKVVYREGRSRGSHEVSIEDPGPEMELCRLATDARNAAAAPALLPPQEAGAAEGQALDWGQLPAFVASARPALLLTPGAATAVFELAVLSSVDQSDAEAVKGFRLAVKGRLFREDEELRCVPDVDARKAELQRRYEELLARYNSVLQRTGPLRLRRPGDEPAKRRDTFVREERPAARQKLLE